MLVLNVFFARLTAQKLFQCMLTVFRQFYRYEDGNLTSNNHKYCRELANKSSTLIQINTTGVLHLHVVSAGGYPKFNMQYNVVPASATGIIHFCISCPQ